MARFAVLYFLCIIAILAMGIGCASSDEPTKKICFQHEVLPILVSNCTNGGCHNNIAKAAELDLTSYEGATKRFIIPGNFSDSRLYRVMASQSEMFAMPGVKDYTLTKNQLDAVGLWISQGAKNDACDSEVEKYCDISAPSYKLHIKPIIEFNCRGCHYEANSTYGYVDLTDYNNVRKYAVEGTTGETSKLIRVLKHDTSGSIPAQPMPRNAAKLPDCTIEVVENWINNGAPNN